MAYYNMIACQDCHRKVHPEFIYSGRCKACDDAFEEQMDRGYYDEYEEESNDDQNERI